MQLYQKIGGQNGENNGCENHKTKIEQNAFVWLDKDYRHYRGDLYCMVVGIYDDGNANYDDAEILRL